MKWEMVKLGEICTIFGGGTPDRSNPSYWDGSIPWVTVKDFKSTTIESSQESITELGLKNSASNLIKAGTIIIPTRMALGKAAICKIDIAINQDLKAIQIKDESILNRDYLLQFLISNASYFESRGKGATVKGITLDILLELQVPLPPLATQRRIAEILDKADALRQKDQALLRKYDELAQAVFVDMFGDPVRNEKGWEVRKLGEMGKLDRGVSKHRPRNAPELLGGNYPLIQTGDVANCDGLIVNFKNTYSEIGLKQSRLWQKGTLCITIAANIAKTGILTFDACFPDSVVGFIPNFKFTNTHFIQAWFSFFQKILEESAPESAQKNINLEILRNLEVICPTLDLQEKFRKIIDHLNHQKRLSKSINSKSEDFFQSLLQKAFTGELVE
jgi:type I restriction enzyme S subunit